MSLPIALTERGWISQQTLSVVLNTMSVNGMDIKPESHKHPNFSDKSRAGPEPEPIPSYAPPMPARTPFGSQQQQFGSQLLRSASLSTTGSPAMAKALNGSPPTAPSLPRRLPSHTSHQIATPPDSRSVTPVITPIVQSTVYKKAVNSASGPNTLHKSPSMPKIQYSALKAAAPVAVAAVAPPPVAARPAGRKTVVAIEDHVPAEEGDLGFAKGDIVVVTEEVDENWFRGTFRGQSGIFPKSFVQARS
ncbi:hypothetical protein DFJ77DRAFT_464271 [Powellomyces hirtus]|nr:hypothetical protein DFJ77DRAFT_464271 [Powellomyces hirtus]